MDAFASGVRTQQEVTRRHLLTTAGLGIGAMAMQSMEQAVADGSSAHQRHPAAGVGRAKSVIYLHMAGSPSQLELFDYKPELQKFHNTECPKEYLEGKRFAFIKGVPRMLGGQFSFHQSGQSGQWISELLPKLAATIDDVCVIRTVNTDQFNHAPAQLLLQTGQPRLGNPGMGSWITWGIGSESQDLPGFVVLASGGKTPSAGKSLWGSGFLPTVYQGVQCRTTGDPVLYLSDPAGISRQLRRSSLDAVRDLNQHRFEQTHDTEIQTRIAQYELAYRMQTAVPEVMDISREPQHILDLYGAVPGFQSAAESADDPRVLYKGDDPTFANNCLLARRLVEQGVRFVQLYDWGWDHHGSSPGESIDETLPIKAGQIDRAVAGLLTDLKQRGLLDSTLVVWGGEFGRTPMMQNNVRSELKAGFIGRDHHPYAFTMWMAGAGIRGGLAYGATDEIGYYIGENPVGIRDLQATILHLVGLDPFRFSFRYQGLDNRLIGPTDDGHILHQILS
ncbi:MAG: DUF1501 domain-containing protein [Planctomycetaceae bacterium]|nr:DUF1501 domain-containing protein [Planctomycetaceae bacterium]